MRKNYEVDKLFESFYIGARFGENHFHTGKPYVLNKRSQLQALKERDEWRTWDNDKNVWGESNYKTCLSMQRYHQKIRMKMKMKMKVKTNGKCRAKITAGSLLQEESIKYFTHLTAVSIVNEWKIKTELNFTLTK
jgi:hypothetical protein